MMMVKCSEISNKRGLLASSLLMVFFSVGAGGLPAPAFHHPSVAVLAISTNNATPVGRTSSLKS